MKVSRNTFIRLLERTLADIKADNSELSESEMLDIMGVLCHQGMSKASACRYLNISRSQFDSYVREGRMPKGRKVIGYKELRWYRDELDECKENLKQ